MEAVYQAGIVEYACFIVVGGLCGIGEDDLIVFYLDLFDLPGVYHVQEGVVAYLGYLGGEGLWDEEGVQKDHY